MLREVSTPVLVVSAALIAPAFVSPSSAAQIRQTQTFLDVSDARLTDSDGNGTFESSTTGSGLSVRNFDNTLNPLQEQSVIEFNVSSLPDGATINSVTLRLNVTGFTSNSTGVTVFVGGGNGSADSGDLNVTSLAGSFNPSDLGTIDVPLNGKVTDALLAGNDFVALRLFGSEPTNLQFSDRFSPSGGAPVLLVDSTFTAVPEPSTAAAVVLGVAGLVCRRQWRVG